MAGWEWTFHFVRHAESEQNLLSDVIGGRSPETPLSPFGRMQAERLRDRFGLAGTAFSEVWQSPLVRARQTCETILRGMASTKFLTVHTDARLEEYAAGAWEHRPRAECYTPDVLRELDRVHMDFAPPGGESLRAVERRAVGWLRDAYLDDDLKLEDPHDRRILVVTHGMVIKCLLHHILGFDDRLTWRVRIDNTSQTVVRFTARGWFLDAVNDTAHLF
jgi:broad specificity phosphatase PhoE